jgi:RND family efflux transporter MFP subunit
MAGTLREELASLKIDRPDSIGVRRNGHRPKSSGRRGGGALRLVSWLVWLTPMLILAIAGVVGYEQYDRMRSRPVVTTGLVELKSWADAATLLDAKGYLKSRYQALIGTKLPGRVEEMRVTEGAQVKKGELLAVIEHNELKAMLASREAQALRTAAELEEARANLWEKEREDRRVSHLFDKKSATHEEVERAIAGHKKAEARVAALEASVKLVNADIQEIKATIATMHLYAPFDGTVVEKQGEVGEIISPSAMSTSWGRTAVVTLADLGHMDVEADVSEALLSRITIGQPASVSVAAVPPPKRYRGRLRKVLPMSDRARSTVKVKVEILDPDEKLFPELAATVHFLPNETANSLDAGRMSLFVPKSAVFQENGHDYVWVVRAGNTLRKNKVDVTTTTEDLARVESGLTAGDRVVVGPAKTLREDETVRIGD